MEIEEERKQIFIATVCSICRFCSDPKPNFCLLMYDTDGEQFIREIVSRIGRLKDVSPGLSGKILSSFEGFNGLFCKKSRCPLYDNQCQVKLSTRITCYRSFMEQNGVEIKLGELSTVYKKWSGAALNEIGRDFSQIVDMDRPLSKSQRKKLRKLVKKARKKMPDAKKTKTKSNQYNPTVIYKKGQKKEAKTSFFCNSNNEWKEKISQYLTKNEQHKDNNRQPSEVVKCAGQPD